MGIVIIILGAKLRQAAIFKNDDPTVEKIGSAAFYIMIIFGSVAIALCILGLLSARCKHWFCNGCVSICLETPYPESSGLDVTLFILEISETNLFYSSDFGH